MRLLQGEFAILNTPPALALLCQGNTTGGINTAGCSLEEREPSAGKPERTGVPYAGVLGSLSRGPIPPAIFYDPNQLMLRSWANPGDPNVYDDQRNVARFAVATSGSRRE
ncbi:hypothetical protein [Nucisporomicrobium flavum]|uniref:hypothetical protein n=1 Tax=Nucisporomicrobium flavum TaxID=2785915 RepID=UPI0018F5A4C8|nr:hypothetical protein [Nucisporomicrobium flavum]